MLKRKKPTRAAFHVVATHWGRYSLLVAPSLVLSTPHSTSRCHNTVHFMHGVIYGCIYPLQCDVHAWLGLYAHLVHSKAIRRLIFLSTPLKMIIAMRDCSRMLPALIFLCCIALGYFFGNAVHAAPALIFMLIEWGGFFSYAMSFIPQARDVVWSILTCCCP